MSGQLSAQGYCLKLFFGALLLPLLLVNAGLDRVPASYANDHDSKLTRRNTPGADLVDFGAVFSYTIFAGSGITSVPGSLTAGQIITGDIGVAPIDVNSITGFGTVTNGYTGSPYLKGTIYGPPHTTTAAADMLAAYNAATGRTATVNLLSGSLDNLGTLGGGTYKWTGSLVLSAGNTLNLSAPCGTVIVFQSSGAIAIGAGANVVLSGGLTAATVYWVGPTTFASGLNSVFNGIILVGTSVVVAGKVTGAIYSQTSVALQMATITFPPPGLGIIPVVSICLPATCNAGFGFQTIHGIPRCTPCLPGFCSPQDGTTCMPCSAGSFSLAQAASCTFCRPGSDSGPAASSCKSCSLGNFAHGDDGILCAPCNPGFFTPHTNTSACTLCPKGFYQPYFESISCMTVDVGSYTSSLGSTDQQKCNIPGDMEQTCDPTTGNAATCTVGFGIQSNSNSCSRCPEGYASTEVDKLCLPCPAGSSSGPGSGICVPCLPGQFSSIGSYCNSCPFGTDSTSGASSCTPCAAGTFRGYGTYGGSGYNGFEYGGLCTACAPGTFTPTTSRNNTQCLTCPVGTTTGTFGATSCTPCTPGTYADGSITAPSNLAVCTDCLAVKSGNSNTCNPQTGSSVSCDAGYGIIGTLPGCNICPAGQYSPVGGTICVSCLGGTFSSAGSAACLPCAASSFSKGSAAICQACPAGSDSPIGQLSCTFCPAGTSSTSGVACALCPLNQFSGAAGSSSCLACPIGTASGLVAGAASCTPCSAGTYADALTGSSVCKPCTMEPGFSTCNPQTGSDVSCDVGYGLKVLGRSPFTSCTPCPSGTYSPQGGTICVPCAAGTSTEVVGFFQKVGAAGASICSPCLPGFVSGIGSGSCAQCPRGYDSQGGTASCSRCAPGTFGGLGITCTLCPSGTFALTSGTQISDTDLNFVGNRDSTFGNSSCTLCPIGTASGTITGAVVCTACSSGTFTDTIGSIQCKPCDLSNGALTCNPQTGKSSMCPIGKGLNVPGAVDSTICSPCDIGTSSPVGGTICTVCAAGTSSIAGQGTCTACLPGQFSALAGKVCINCPAGSDSTSGASSCSPCVAGTFSAGNGAICTSCDKGTFTATTSLNNTQCSTCESGTYSNIIGTITCKACDAGFFSDGSVGTSIACSACKSLVTSTDGTGETCNVKTGSTLLCSTGSGLQDGSSTCSPCRVGYISPLNSVECSICRAGSSSLGGDNSCFTCGAGFNSTVGSACEPCAAGTESAGGSSSCTPCAAGKFSSGNGGLCTACAVGTYYASSSSDNKSPSCVSCSAGTSNSVVGASTCIACTSGFYASKGAASCVACYSLSVGGTCNPQDGTTVTCPLGQGLLLPSGGFNTCQICPSGTISPNGGTICEPCAAGTSSAGGTDSCFSCAPNQFSDSGSICRACQSGYTSPGGTASCTLIPPVAPCAPGTQGGNGYCYECSRGTFNPTAGGYCRNCEPGFESAYGSISCSACGEGTYTPPYYYHNAYFEGGQLHYFEEELSFYPGICSACPINSQIGRASNACNSTTGQPTQCSPGYGTEVENFLGTYSSPYYDRSDPTRFDCRICPAGSYSHTAGIKCSACPIGTTSLPGATKATACFSATYHVTLVQPNTTSVMYLSKDVGNNGYLTVTGDISNALLVVPETLTDNGITNLLTVNYGKFVALSLAKSSQVAFSSNSYYGVLAGSTTVSSNGSYFDGTADFDSTWRTETAIFHTIKNGNNYALELSVTGDEGALDIGLAVFTPQVLLTNYTNNQFVEVYPAFNSSDIQMYLIPTQCDAGSGNCDSTGASSSCLPGYGFLSSSSAKCEACSAGSYSNGVGSAATCTTCTSGTYSNTTGASQLCASNCNLVANQDIACSPTSGITTGCYPGFGIQVGDKHCSACSKGSYSRDNSTTCVGLCSEGVATCTSNVVATSCDAGYGYNVESPSSVHCSTCLAGTFSTGGKMSCATCLTSMDAKCDSKTGAVTSCLAGSGIPVNGTTCSSCPAGSYGDSSLTSLTSLAVCSPCPIGTYTIGESTGVSQCQACPDSTFANVVGTSGACPACPGALTCDPSTGAILKCSPPFVFQASTSTCVSCGHDRYSLDGLECLKCSGVDCQESTALLNSLTAEAHTAALLLISQEAARAAADTADSLATAAIAALLKALQDQSK